MWLGAYSEYVLGSQGIEQRVQRQIVLTPCKVDGMDITKREAQRMLQPLVDKANASLGQSVQAVARKSITFDAFSEVWERDYLSLQKPATQSASRSYLKRLRAAFGTRDMRSVTAGDLQRLIAASSAEG